MDQSEPPVRLQPPPRAVVRVVNPVVRRLLTSPLGSRLPATLHLLEFTGRRSGRRFSVPVGVHEVAGGPVAFTEAAWRSAGKAIRLSPGCCRTPPAARRRRA